ncbi:phage tail tape measure protein [Leifsonia sp. NPDC058292]|uniref:phage tail tape measure protein n=1 Tax=Leifsonia sp. NPDC058292 TaxID=3346428 RepID=UPI0036DC1FFB
MTDRTTKVTLTAQVSGYIAGMEKAAAATRNTGSEAEKLAQKKEAFGQVGKSLLAIGAVAATGVGLAIKKFADFDAQMSQVKTLSHATAGEMEQLTDAALNMGQAIGFSATEVAAAETELVKAGVAVKDIMGGALKGALDLAAAGQIDVAQATEIASSAMVQFGLSGKDVPHIADLLAAGADKALGGVSDLGQALKYAGPVAASFGISLDETVGVLALFAQNGILADQAGTGLRGVLSSLTSPSAAANDILTKYKINLFDSAGKFIGAAGAAGQLHDRLGGLTDQERSYALGQIFGNQQITTATILMKAGAQGVQKMTDAVNDQGFASEQARGKMDNLAGDVKKLGAAFDSGLIKSGSAANGELRGVVQTITNLVAAFNDLPPAAQGTVLAVGAVVAAVALLGGGALALVPKLAAFKIALSDLNTSMKTVGIAGGAVALAIGGLVAIVAAVAGAQAEAKARTDEFTNSLDENTGAITKNTRAVAAKQLHDNGAIAIANKLGVSLKTITDASLGNTSAIQKVNSQFQLWQVTTKGSSAELTQNGILWQDLLGKIGTTSGTLKASQRDWQNNQKAVGDASETTDAAAGSIEALAAETDKASAATDAFNKALAGLGQVNLDASSANIKYNQSLADAAAATAEVGQGLDETTEAGRKNMSALNDIASSAVSLLAAQQAAGTSTETLTANMGAARQAFIDAAVAAGATTDQANKLADQYGLIPADVSTAYHTSGADAAILAAQQLKAAQDAIERNIQIRVTTINTNATNPATDFGLGDGGIHRAGGGLLPGAPSSKDNMRINAASGEFVVNARATSQNLALLNAINSGQSPYAVPVYSPAPSRAWSESAGFGPGSGAVSLSLAGATITATLDGHPIQLMIHDQIVTAQQSESRTAARGYRGA